MDRGARWVTVYRAAKDWIQLKRLGTRGGQNSADQIRLL